MKKFEYSLIIPVHDSEASLNRLFDSICSQKYTFDEIIIVNNSSKDNSLILCKIFQKKYSGEVKIINLKTNNISKARNIGVKHSTKRYILFLDSDDFIYDYYLEYIDKNISKYNECSDNIKVYEFNFVNIFLNKKEKINKYCLKSGIYDNKRYLSKILNKFKQESKFMCWKYVYDRSLFLDKKNLFDEKLNLLEDIDFIFRLCLHNCFLISVISENKIIKYIQNNYSISNKSTKKEYAKSIKYLKNKFNKYNFVKKYLNLLSIKTLDFDTYNCINNNYFNILNYLINKTIIYISKFITK